MHYKHATSSDAKALPRTGLLAMLFNAAHDCYPLLRKQHEMALDAVINAPEGRVVCYPCFVDGKATTAVGIIDMVSNKVVLIPLFIAPTDNMEIMGHAGQPTHDYPYTEAA